MGTKRFKPRKPVGSDYRPEGIITLPDGTVRYPDYGDDLDELAAREAAAIRGHGCRTTADGTPPVQRTNDRPKKRI